MNGQISSTVWSFWMANLHDLDGLNLLGWCYEALSMKFASWSLHIFGWSLMVLVDSRSMP